MIAPPKEESPYVETGAPRTNQRDAGQYSTTEQSPLTRALEVIKVPDAWRLIGLPGNASKSCKAPHRQDRHASFSVFADGRLWKDHTTGASGDTVDFVALVRGCTKGDAARQIIAWAGGAVPGAMPRLAVPAPTRPKRPKLDLHRPSLSDVFTIQALRKLPNCAGIEHAILRGLLYVGNVWDGGEVHPAWILTDSARRNAQARRMDGYHWQGINSKAKTLPGSTNTWPIGCADLGDTKYVILTEGPPDLLAAMTIAWKMREGISSLGFACVTGAGNDLHPEALPHFQGRHVRIVYDQDDAGRAAASKWSQQLKSAGATVDGFDIKGLLKQDGTPAKDLGDLCYYVQDDGETTSTYNEELTGLVTFAGEVVS